MRLTIPEEELLTPGHLACAGCGAALAMRYTLKALGKDTILVIPACCWSIIQGPFPHNACKVPILNIAFEAAASAASGVAAALKIKGKKTNVVAWAGDGGTFDIGLQALSAAAERNDNIIYVCYDNEAYQNTGIQRSSATPYLAWTTTTPKNAPKSEPKKDIIAIMAAHNIPYVATASIAYPEDMIKKFQKAAKIKGTKFFHILCPCPPGWKSREQDTVKLARLAVRTKVFPLLEIEEGIWKINIKPKGIPVEEYLKLQGRFSHLKEEDFKIIQKNVDDNWEKLLKKAEAQ